MMSKLSRSRALYSPPLRLALLSAPEGFEPSIRYVFLEWIRPFQFSNVYMVARLTKGHAQFRCSCRPLGGHCAVGRLLAESETVIYAHRERTQPARTR